MTDIPRGKYIGRRLGDPPASEAEHFIRCPSAAAGSTAVISAKCSSMKGRCRTRRRINRNDIKNKNPHSMVEVKHLQSGDVTAVAHRPE